jgi:hypothetical protein
MFWNQWLATRFACKVAPKNRRRGSAKPGLQLRVECLETRAVPSASVWTNKLDYRPGSTAILEAGGFLPGETVEFQVVHIDGRPNTGYLHAPFYVTDGDKGDRDGKRDGSIETTWYVNPADSVGATFKLTAIGLTSGRVATAVFTDDSGNEGASANPTNTATVTSAVTITLTGTDEDNNFAEDPLYHFDITSGPSHGSLNVANPQNFTGSIATVGGVMEMTTSVTYTPNSGFTGQDSFTFVTVGDASNSPPVTVTITVDPAIAAVAGSGQQAFISSQFGTQLQARLLDASHNPIAGAMVTFTAPSSGASATFANGTTTDTVTTNANGIATSSVLTANATTGSYVVTATSPAVTGTASFSLTNAQAIVTVVAPAPTTAVINTAFSPNLAVVVKDGNGNPIASASVTFTINPVAGAGAAFASGQTFTATTGANGIVTATTLTADGVAGSYTVTAALTGGGSSVNFNLTNIKGGLRFTGQPPASILGGTPFVVTLQLVDNSGHAVASANRVVTLLLSNGTALGTANTNASGSATFTVTIRLPGTYALEAELDGSTPFVSNLFTVRNRYRFGP